MAVHPQDLTVRMNRRGDALVTWTASTRQDDYPGREAGLDAAFKHAAGDWAATEVAVPVGPGIGPQHDVALDEDGNAVVAWSTWEASDGGPPSGLFITTYHRDAATGWTSRERLNPRPACCGQEAPGNIEAMPRVAFDADGDAVLLWTDNPNDATLLRAAVRPRGGSFGPFETLAEPDGTIAETALATDANGFALAVWSTKEDLDRPDSGVNRVRAAFLDPDAPTITAVRARATRLRYKLTDPARVTARVRRGKRVAVLRSKRARRAGALVLPRRLGRYRARITATTPDGKTGLARRVAFRKRR